MTLLLTLLAGLAACAHGSAAGGPAGVGDPRAAAIAQVEAALHRYAELTLAMDHAGLASLFAPEGALIDESRGAIRGPLAIREYLEGFAGFKVLENRTEADLTQVEGRRATQRGHYRQRVRLPSGEVVEVSGAFEAFWIRTRGAWLIERMGTTPG